MQQSKIQNLKSKIHLILVGKRGANLSVSDEGQVCSLRTKERIFSIPSSGQIPARVCLGKIVVLKSIGAAGFEPAILR